MAILNLKNNKKTSEPKKATKKVAVKAEAKAMILAPMAGSVLSNTGVIIRPRVTEKATFLSGNGDRMVYVFDVTNSANKTNVASAIKTLYKVVPAKVSILKVPSKKSFVRGRVSTGKTGRKAYVYLQKGDKIDLA